MDSSGSDPEIEEVPEAIKQLEQAIASGNGPDGKPLTDQQKADLPNALANQKAYLEELKQIQIVLPTITFDRSLILHKPDRDIHIYFLGRGHTRGDVVVYLPKEKVVMTGDLLTNGIPFMRDAYPVEWVSTLEGLRNLDWAQAIPGHGDVQQGKAQIEKLIAYMRDVVAGVKDAVAKGMTLEDAKKSLTLPQHSESFGQNYPFTRANAAMIDRTWAEVTGKIPD